MPVATQLAAYAVAAAICCSLLTAAWIAIARRNRIQDEPGRRRLHGSATPRGGGIAIAIVVGLSLALMAGSGPAHSLLPLSAGIAAFAALGLLDDLVPVSAPVKFGLQLLAGAVLVFGIADDWGLGWPALAVAAVACAYVVNIWNFMDGSNGLISTQALLISAGIAMWPGEPDYLRQAAAVLAGACIGFLPFNLPSARVFLGDVGSHALGASVFGLLALAWHEQAIGLVQILGIGTVLLLDSGLTLVRRALKGRKVWQAHREHLYQYAVRRGASHLRVAMAYAAWTTVAIVVAAYGTAVRSSFVIWSSFILGWFLAACVYFGLRQRWLKPGMRRELDHE